MSTRRPYHAKAAIAASLVAATLLLTRCAGVTTDVPAGPAVVAGQQSPAAEPMALPNRDGSLKFLAFGDSGTGEPEQFQLAAQMTTLHARFPFEMAILLGDNIYGTQRPQDFRNKFEVPYKPLIDAGVKFYASLGNHDAIEQRFQGYFNMESKRYYTFKAPKGDVRFFALESSNPVPEQIKWVEEQLKGATDPWKIAFFHHPLYSSARGHGSTVDLRDTLAPLFVRYNVSVVFSGHDHVYERVKPQNGVAYFVVGSAGKLRPNDLNRRSSFFAAGFDTDLAFLAAEIVDDKMYFQAISRTGRIVDSGVIIRRQATGAGAAPPQARAPASAWRFPSLLQTPAAAAGQSAHR
ncbi:MAG TPA: metallophosphoesterase [Vicinamibacterales bacterium]|nr:metallophosphoesterase [Vicinamibacterales bacterium]